MGSNKERTIDKMEKHLRKLNRSLYVVTKQILRNLGLSTSRFFILMHLSHEEMSMGQLRKVSHVSRSTLTSLVDGLTSEGLVSRRRGKQDRRKVRVEITDEGKNIVETVLEKKRAIIDEATTKMSENEINCFLQHIRQVNRFMDKKTHKDN